MHEHDYEDGYEHGWAHGYERGFSVALRILKNSFELPVETHQWIEKEIARLDRAHG